MTLEVAEGPDVAETKLTGVLDIVWAVALAAVTACPWLSPADTDPPQPQTRAAAAAKQTMNRCMVVIRAWSAYSVRAQRRSCFSFLLRSHDPRLDIGRRWPRLSSRTVVCSARRCDCGRPSRHLRMLGWSARPFPERRVRPSSPGRPSNEAESGRGQHCRRAILGRR